MEFLTTSPEETERVAARVIGALKALPGTRAAATILALKGELGAGKTAFTKGVAEALGVVEVVTSPTFVIEKIYELPTSTWKRLIHIDAYRLEAESELRAIGWHEAATDPGNIMVVEWPERAGRGIPTRAYWLEFEHVGDTMRRIVVDERLTLDADL